MNVHGQTTATLANGSTMQVADVSFEYTQAITDSSANAAQLLIAQAMANANHVVI